MIEKWEIQYGEKTIPVTAEDFAETLERAISIVNYYLRTNPQIKSNVKMKVIYDLDIQTLGLARKMFLGFAEELDKPKEPTLTTVKKRRPS